MKSKILFCLPILLLIFGIFLINGNSSAQYITYPLRSELTLGSNGLLSLDLTSGWNRMYIFNQFSNAPYTFGQYLFSNFGASSYGLNNFGLTNNLFNLPLTILDNNIRSPQSYNIDNFNPYNNFYTPSPIYNLNIIQDWQYMNPLTFITHKQDMDVDGTGGQNGPNIARPTTRGRALAALTPVNNCDALLAQLKADAIQEIEEKIDLNIEKVISCGGCCNHFYYPYPYYPCWGISYGGYSYSSSPQTNSLGAWNSIGAWGGDIDTASPTSTESASEYSTTNVQVTGVDEADFIKNDGSYIYILANDKFQIINAWPPKDADIISAVDIEGIPKKLFVANDRALIYSSLDYLDGGGGGKDGECTYGYNCDFTGDKRKLKITVFDISDRTNPVISRELKFGGSYINSRRVGKAVHTVIFSPAFFSPEIKYWPEIYDECQGYYYPWLDFSKFCVGNDCNFDNPTDEPTLEELLAAFEQLKEQNREIIENSTIVDWIPGIRDTIHTANGEVVNDSLLYDCTDFYETGTPDQKSFLTIVSMDIDGMELNRVTVFGHPGAVYSSHSALYMSSRQKYTSGCQWFYNASSGIQEASTVHKFRLQNTSPPGCEYAGSGVVKGRVLNQFSMDEYDDHLRMATTTNRVPSPDVHSTLSVLEEDSGELRVVGQVDHIAPKEDIRSVRFDGTRGFIVTFKKTDPLFAFNLSNHSAPEIVGELKIPGYSTYIHLMDHDHLLTIGYDSEDHGSFAWFQGIMLQIFDVSNMSAPVLLHKWVIGTRGSTSDAATNHLAFNYFAPKNLLAIPITVCEGGSGGGSYGTEMTFSGLIVFNATIENGFSENGRVSHLDPCAEDCWGVCSNWWTNSNSVVKRSIFMDDYVYSVASDQIIINDLNIGQDVRVIDLP